VRREIFHNILDEFGIPVEKIIKMCLIETQNKASIGKILMHSLFRTVCIKEMLYLNSFSTTLYTTHQSGSRK
jgi:hypothetical protein